MKKIIIIASLALLAATTTVWAAQAKYKVFCPEHDKVIKYTSDWDEAKSYSKNHNSGARHNSYPTNNN
ncbi:hypothetical protein [Teredinibacter purpureus]|uniref:hypothetical protein n=1 Tax=Teredinibacter purpureus TaxID=2731756 RepID=UPI0005F84770|nr:hypothetical protein [Teredinibacter purpureus]